MTGRRWLQGLYLLLAVAGLVWPWIYNLEVIASGEGLGAFADAAFATPAAASLTVDLIVAYVAFVVFVAAESVRLRIRWGWLLIPLSAVTSFAFAFPLFLALRERTLASAGSAA